MDIVIKSYNFSENKLWEIPRFYCIW